ncbi:hypothetical protein ACFLV0_00865 [Chloroflexota bacterium]
MKKALITGIAGQDGREARIGLGNYFRKECGAEAQNRTGDTRIFSPLLYR